MSRQRLHAKPSFQRTHASQKSDNETATINSRTNITAVPRGKPSVEGFATRGLGDLEALDSLPGNNILVEKSFSRSEN